MKLGRNLQNATLPANNKDNVLSFFFLSLFGETVFSKSNGLWGWHLYRCGKARSRPVIKALTQGKKKEKVLSSVIFWQGSERRAKQYSYMLGSSWKKNDCMFDCLIARLYLQAIVLGDSDQSCVHVICLCSGGVLQCTGVIFSYRKLLLEPL